MIGKTQIEKEAMIKGQEYYAGKMAIDEKKRMVCR